MFYRINARGSNKLGSENKIRPAKWKFITELNKLIQQTGVNTANSNINENTLRVAIQNFYPELFNSCRVRRKFSFKPANQTKIKTFYQQKIAIGEMHKIKGFRRKTTFRLKGVPIMQLTVSKET